MIHNFFVVRYIILPLSRLEALKFKAYKFLCCPPLRFVLALSDSTFKFLCCPPLRFVLALSGSTFSIPAIGSRVVSVFHPCRSISALSGPAFTTPAIHSSVVWSCVFYRRAPYPRFLVPTCQVLRFQAPYPH